MTLYEIDQAILGCADQETGEVIDFKQLEDLVMERDQKLENIGLWIKNMTIENKAIDEEMCRLRDMKARNERKIESLKSLLDQYLQGNRFKTVKVSISYRNSKRVEVPDISQLPKKFRRYKDPEPDKTAIRTALEAGEKVRGASLVAYTSLTVR